MKTYGLHAYHGITQRDDAWGWVVQIKLMGKYRVLRTYAKDAEEAARRHDIALSKLDSFTELSVRPNFPIDFDTLDISRNARPGDDSYKSFFDDLHTLFSELCKEAESAGLDPSEMRNDRARLAKTLLESRRLKALTAHAKFLSGLVKLRNVVPSLGFSTDKSEQLADILAKAQELFDKP